MMEVETKAPKHSDLDDKYKELLSKIKKQKEAANEALNNESQDEDNDSNGTQDQLKMLYDASVLFKNDLASLRTQIKSITQKTS